MTTIDVAPADAPPPALTDRDRETRALIGLAIGIGLAVALSAPGLLLCGWRALRFSPIVHMLWSPCLFATLGYLGARPSRCRPRLSIAGVKGFNVFNMFLCVGILTHAMMDLRVIDWGMVGIPIVAALIFASVEWPASADWPQRLPSLRIRSLMALVAYVALLLGVGLVGERVGRPALDFSNRASSHEALAESYRALCVGPERETAQRLANVAQLRAGTIPNGLMPEKVAFLRSVDATPEYRRHRYGVVESLEEQAGRSAAEEVVVWRRLIHHHQTLAAKYRRATRFPWLPVEPDPPEPPLE